VASGGGVVKAGMWAACRWPRPSALGPCFVRASRRMLASVAVAADRRPGGAPVAGRGHGEGRAVDAITAAEAVRAPVVAPSGAAERAFLLAQGFTALEAAHLIARKREEAARLPEGRSEERLRFARWLVAHGRLHEGGPAPSPACGDPPG
jgi:hypothetical protein